MTSCASFEGSVFIGFLLRPIFEPSIGQCAVVRSEIGIEVRRDGDERRQLGRRMEERGVILGYTINVDLENIGYRDTFIVQVILETHSEKTLNEFGRALDLIPEVTEAYLVSGEYDYYMKVAIKDTRDYERLLREQLYKIPGVRHTKSSLVLRKLKQSSFPVSDHR